MLHQPDRLIDRRRLTVGGLVGVASLALGSRVVSAGVVGSNATPTVADGAQSDGSWAFFDDTGKEIVLDSVPGVLAGQTSAMAALYDFGVPITAIYGPSVDAEGKPDFQAGNLPLDEITVLGNWGSDSMELDIEKVIEISPDIIVDMVTAPDQYWYLSGDARSRVEELEIPILGISMLQVSLLETIHRFQDLAVALGADLDAPEIAAAIETHAISETALKQAIAAKPGLRVLCISPEVEQIYIATPRYMDDLRYFQDLGLEMVDHQTDDWWEIVSWEEIDKYPADLIITDARPEVIQPADLAEKVPVWNTLPAVVAGQVGPWYAGAPASYSRLAPVLDSMTELVNKSEAGVS